ncbi:WbqC family protein [Fulvivirga maritima]|uniref:WbqC family protein n=1 Tax=Fulvivirga maritima TaxID=2904247 RepID=UPI001F2FF6CB|nr:WbqC family protein [Fulvivirga maritima]UII28747.1 WbqC family protein [Fulvivirga maritima]
MSSVVLDLHYLPSLEYFCCINQFDNIIIEQEEYFEKQSYRNRCHILSANKAERLIVPVIGGRKKIKVKDIQIDYSQKWLLNHLRAIQSAYGKAPFYEYFIDHFEEIFQKRDKFLFDLNLNLLKICLKFLQIDKPITFTNSYIKYSEANIKDYRSVVHPKKDYKTNSIYQPQEYPQVFGVSFAENLSIIDLLFCEGPNSKNIINQSTRLKVNI